MEKRHVYKLLILVGTFYFNFLRLATSHNHNKIVKHFTCFGAWYEMMLRRFDFSYITKWFLYSLVTVFNC